ncbi:MAG TPA: TolC family protein [Firmicutes bacterium]|nr:TolC family protein [Bacillota bacterium]
MKRIMIVMTALFLAAAVSGADKIKLSMDKAVEMAFENNDILRMEREKVYAAENTARSTVAAFLPQLKASFDWTRYYEKPVMEFDMSVMGGMFAPLFGALGLPAPEMGIIEIEAAREFEASFGLTLTQPLFLGGKMFNAVMSAGLAENVQKQAYEAAAAEIEYYTKLSYLNALYTRDIYEISRLAYERALENRELMKRRVSSGRMSRMENIRMEADVAVKKPKMLEAKMNYETAVRSLKRLIGLDGGAETELTDRMREKFGDYDREELKKKMAESNPLIKIAEDMVSLYETLLNMERSAYLPNIYGFASYRYAGGSSDVFIGSENINRMMLVGIKAEYELFTSGKRVFENSRAENELNEKKINLEKVKRELDFELEKMLSEYEMMRQTYGEILNSVKLTREAYNIVYEVFESGFATRNDLNDAENSYDEAVKGQKRILMGINAAAAGIEKLTGGGE